MQFSCIIYDPTAWGSKGLRNDFRGLFEPRENVEQEPLLVCLMLLNIPIVNVFVVCCYTSYRAHINPLAKHCLTCGKSNIHTEKGQISIWSSLYGYGNPSSSLDRINGFKRHRIDSKRADEAVTSAGLLPIPVEPSTSQSCHATFI